MISVAYWSGRGGTYLVWLRGRVSEWKLARGFRWPAMGCKCNTTSRA